jgi:hypothetical protein
MTDYNHFNSAQHQGYLPVRVLSYNFLEWFENITPDFKDDIKSEINFNALQSGITYHIQRERITECAELTSLGKIALYENFNQYLWCICYSLSTLYDESILKPHNEGTYTGRFDLTNPWVKTAIEVFNTGFGLIDSFKEHEFFSLPNPEKYDKKDEHYIEKTNAIYTAAMTFILLHEFGHQYLGHLKYYPTNDESKKDEFTADDYAIDKMSNSFHTERGETFKIGIVAGLCSLIFLDNSLSGGNTHPDLDDRLKVAMSKLQLDELDHSWGVACLALRLWTIKYNIRIDLPAEVETHKDCFNWMIEKLAENK